MSAVIEAAVAALSDKVAGGFDGVAKFVISGEGAVVIDQNGARASDEAADDGADVTLTANADDFQSMLAGELNPTTAFMTGKLAIDGDMGKAMALGSVLG